MTSAKFAHSIAFASGKGGVGKTTTSVNYAIALAKNGYRTGLVDLDPLSNVATLLDIKLPESPSLLDMARPLQAYTHSVFRNLDLLFYSEKAEKNASKALERRLCSDFYDDLVKKYDFLVFDMPAGMDEDENLVFTVLVQTLVIVTNPEPTAHVAAGSYIKKVHERNGKMPVIIWHNRYSEVASRTFDSRDVIANYNRNVSEEESLSPDIKLIHIACIPSDPSLDLLHGAPSVTLQVQRSMENLLSLILEKHIRSIIDDTGMKGRITDVLAFYINSCVKQEKKDTEFIKGYGSYLNAILENKLNISIDIPMFTSREAQMLEALFESVKNNTLVRQTLLVLKLCRQNIDAIGNSDNQFMPIHTNQRNNELEREMIRLLSFTGSEPDPVLRNHAGVLLFYLALFKLFHSKTLVNMLHDFIPVTTDSKGKKKRDRYTQIRNLVENPAIYRQKYLGLIRQLMPVLTRQINALSSTFSLKTLFLRNEKNEIAKEAYVKLLSNFFHDTIYSGLSVMTGFSYRAAAIEFEKGYRKLMDEHRKKTA